MRGNTRDGHDLIGTPVEKKGIQEDSDKLLSRIDIQIEENNAQIDQNSRSSNIKSDTLEKADE